LGQGAAAAVPYAAVASVWAWPVTAFAVVYNVPPVTMDAVSPVTEGEAGALPTEPRIVVPESTLVTPAEASTPNWAAVFRSGVVA
jgi:hypothetical protein